MSGELASLLLLFAVCVPVGLVIGVALRKMRPGWCKRYVKFCLNRRWPIFGAGLLLGCALATASFLQGRPYFGSYFAVFAALELYALLGYGFKPLTPEMAKQIDESDPTKLWPLSLHKRKKTG